MPEIMTPRVEIRDAVAADIEAVANLLAAGFRQVPVAFWRTMLTTPWLPAESIPDIGAVVVSGGEVVGFLGAKYSNRQVGKRLERFCNVFAWYVAEEYRRYSLSLLSFVLRRPNLTFVNVTPASHVLPLFERLRFVLADEHRLICTPSLNGT